MSPKFFSPKSVSEFSESAPTCVTLTFKEMLISNDYVICSQMFFSRSFFFNRQVRKSPCGT